MSENAVIDAVIDVRGLTKRFGDLVAFDHLDMTVPRGAIYGFLGPNGSGKTTTIRMMCGLLKPDDGKGTCLGFDVLRDSRRIKAHVGYMTQRFSLYEDLTIRENLEFMARMYDVPHQRARVDQSLKELGLESRGGQLAGTLSGGWKQRLALAAAIQHEPKLLLLDEPTAGVDPKARRDFWDRIRELSRAGITVLVSTHYMDEAVQCDYIAYIAYGKKLIDAPAGDISELSGLHTWRVEGSGLDGLAAKLRGAPGVEQVVRFGTALHVSGVDKELLSQAVNEAAGQGSFKLTLQPASLEEVFIHLMAGTEGAT
jgi:ABC-2 type transport system ATP-binding protein